MTPKQPTLSSNRIHALTPIALRVLSLVLLTFTLPATETAASQVLQPVTTLLSVPFSGTMVTDVENISVKGVLHIRIESIFTRTTVFTKVITSISQTVGFGLASGQAFEGGESSVNTCSIPAESRRSDSLPLEFVSQHRLVPTGRVFEVYEGVRERALILIPEITFGRDGIIAGASVRIGSTRFRPASVQMH